MVLGLPDEEAWRRCAAWSTDLGLALGVHVARDLPRVEAALEGLYGYADERRRRRGGASRATTRHALCCEVARRRRRAARLDRLARLRRASTRRATSSGSRWQTFLEHPDQWALLAERPELGRAAVDEVMRVDPTTTWTTREADRGLRVPGRRVPRAARPCTSCPPSAGTDPRRVRTRSLRHHRAARARTSDSAAASTTASGTSSPARTWRRPCRCWRGGCRRRALDGEPRWLPLTGNTGPVALPIAF